jgi:hypothetical protein
MGPGIEGYHVLGEGKMTHIGHGDEIWTYWTTDLVHWANWASGPRRGYEKLIAIKSEGTWHLLNKADSLGMDQSPDQMRKLLAMKLKLLPEELVVHATTEPAIPLIEKWVQPISSWRVEFRAPERNESVEITVQFDGRSYLATIRRRRTLDQLDQRLSSFPQRDDWTSWYRPGGIRSDRGIGLYNWQKDDVLEIRRDTGQEIPLLVGFRHDTMVKADSREWQIEREANKWAESTYGLNPRSLKTQTFEERPFYPKV